jgi:hypothetical protein
MLCSYVAYYQQSFGEETMKHIMTRRGITVCLVCAVLFLANGDLLESAEAVESDTCQEEVFLVASWIYFEFPGPGTVKTISYSNVADVDLEIGTQDCCILDDVVEIYVDGCLVGVHRSVDGIKYAYQTVSLMPGDHVINLVNSESSISASGWYYKLEENPYTGLPWPCSQLHALCVGMDYGQSLNGKADAQAIYEKLKKFNIWASTNPTPLILNPNNSASANLSQIQQSLENIKSNLKSGDSFVFYFSGHGGFPTTSGGDETPVWISIGPWDLWNKHDEYLVTGAGTWSFLLSDDSLASWLDDPVWDEVHKLVLLDACHSGGFWGDNNPSDSGDLEKLPRVALMAACPEWGVSFSSPTDGRGLWTMRLGWALGVAILIEDIASLIADWDWSEYVGKGLTLRIEDFFPPEQSSLIFNGSYWQPVFYRSEDFSMSFPQLSNLPPIADAGTDQIVEASSPDGALVTLDGSGSTDDGQLQPLTYTWTWTSGSSTGVKPTIILPLGTTTVTLTVNDGELSDVDTVNVTVEDTSPPEIFISEPTLYGLYAAGDLALDFSAYDLVSGWLDPPALCGKLADTSGYSPSVVPGFVPGPGVYTFVVSAEDQASNYAESEPVLFTVYDPDGGFVTGGGWIDSPEGALAAAPLLSGKANFGFVSKYKKGASTPTGNTEFQFYAGGLNFHSSSYEWLVVTGSDYARFKGTGTIMDVPGDFKFMLWAGDSEPDTFRIRIWEENEETAEETLIYDNGMNQPIGGGSIIIHTSKK